MAAAGIRSRQILTTLRRWRSSIQCNARLYSLRCPSFQNLISPCWPSRATVISEGCCTPPLLGRLASGVRRGGGPPMGAARADSHRGDGRRMHAITVELSAQVK
jgi:hypothetical protein